jgi:hypothetical protein
VSERVRLNGIPGGFLNHPLRIRTGFFLAFALLGWNAIPAHAAECGTARLFEPGKGPRAAFKTGARARASAADNRARTLVTPHFLIHYSLRAWHKVHIEPEDSPLMRAADSLYALMDDLPEAKRDSTVYARLDSAGYPHPVYIQRMRDHFEAAIAAYVDRLGMRAPVSAVLSVQYNVSPSLPRRFPIDVVDVGTADSFFAGETYGVTYPPDNLSITFENDFICRTTLDAQGRIHGDSIKSRLAGEVIHNYAAEFEAGIKVTAFHEFYHAVQFTYLPRVNAYHAWYEISATGMEERYAGEVNDYLQYLPCVLFNHERLPLLSNSQGPCSHAPVYGQGIFHQYLGHALDSLFDVRVWDKLSRNGDLLREGLESAFAYYGTSMSSLYPDYAWQLLFAGNRFPRPDTLFTPDMPLWPGISLDSIDLSGDSPNRVLTLPTLTFTVLKVKWGPQAEPRILQAKVAKGISRIHANASASMVEHLPETRFVLGAPKEGFTEYYLVLPNPSYTDMATVEIKDSDDEFYAYPNPVRIAFPSTAYFSQARSMAFPSRIEIFGENGRLVRSLGFADASQSLSWDLKDARNQTVKPGVYYYRVAGEALKVMVVLR